MSSTLSKSNFIQKYSFWGRLTVIFLLTFLFYLPSLDCGYIWDDDDYPLRAQELGSFEGLKLIWFEPEATSQYYPLVHTSYWLENWLWGSDPQGYHLTNILLHIFNTMLLWRVLAVLRIPFSWFISLVFALHPVQVESVTWITERKNVLSTFFYFLSAWIFLKKDLFSTLSGNKIIFYVMSLMSFVLAMLSKTVTCSLPAALLLILWWQRGRISLREFVKVIPYFVIGLALGLHTAFIESSRHAFGEAWDLNFLERCLIAGRAVCFYVSKLLWPTDLAFIYPRWQIDTSAWWQYLFPLGILSALFVLWNHRLRWGRGPLVAVLFFIGTLFPALGFFDVYPFLYSFVADHFQYLASVGMLVLLVSMTCHFLEKFGNLGQVGGIIVLVVLGILTWRQQSQYQNSETLWRETIQKNPICWLAYNNLGYELDNQGKEEEATFYYRQSLHHNPDYIVAINNVAQKLLQKKQWNEAKKLVKRAVDINQKHYALTSRHNMDSAVTQCLLGDLFYHQGHYDQAIEKYETSLQINPHYLVALIQLGNLFFSQKNFDKAIIYYNKVLSIEKDHSVALNNLGAIYRNLGDLKKALIIYSTILSLV